MRKKIFCTLISLIIVLSLVGCGSSDAVTTPASAAPAVTEPAPEPEPEPEPEVVEEAPVIEETVAEEPAPEEEAKVEEEPAVEEPVEEEPAEPTEEEIVEAVLANEDFYEDGAFVPKLYAESLGYKWYADFGTEVDLSAMIDDTEYFIWFMSQSLNIVYTDGERCYGETVIDMPKEVRSETTAVKIGDTTTDNSSLYVKSIVAIIYRLGNGDNLLKTWEFKGLSYGYSQHNCKAEFFDDGYIDSTKLTNQDEDNSFAVKYDE